MLDEYLSVSTIHTFIRQDKRNEVVYTDIGSDKELIIKNGVMKAKRVTPQHSQLVLEYTLQGHKGFYFETLSDEQYKLFENIFATLAH